MSLPPADVLGAAFHEDVEPPDTDAMVRAIEPAAAALRHALAEVRLVDLVAATPDQRAGIVALRQALDVAVRDASTIVSAIDMVFREAARQSGAKQIPAGSAGIVRVEQRGEWKVDVPKMRATLEELVKAGAISQPELDYTITTEVVTKADNRKLNFLADNRGDAVREAIDAHRSYLINPQAARLTYAKTDR